jgi:hypothetical protein
VRRVTTGYKCFTFPGCYPHDHDGIIAHHGQNPVADEAKHLALGPKHGRQPLAIPLPDDDNALALAVLVLCLAAVYPVSLQVRRPNVAAVDPGSLASAAIDLTLQFRCHGFPQLMHSYDAQQRARSVPYSCQWRNRTLIPWCLRFECELKWAEAGFRSRFFHSPYESSAKGRGFS